MENITLHCYGCQIEKPVSEFYKRTDTKRGYLIKCKACLAKQYQDNKHKDAKTRNIHDLSNKNLYPLYHRYLSNRSILNIYSTIPIKIGQTIILNGVKYKIDKIRKRFDSDPKNYRFKKVILFYYDEVRLKTAN